MNSLRSHRSKMIMAAVIMNNSDAEATAAGPSTETNECFPTNERSLEPINAPSISYEHINPATDIEDLITVSDLDDSVEDPNFELSEGNKSDKDTSGSESEPTVLRDYIISTSSLNLPPNNQFKANFVAAYPGPLYIYGEHLPDSEISVTAAPPQSLQTSEQKRKAKHPMIENSCDNSKCKRQCAMFSLESRKNIWEEYWNQGFLSRRSFLNKCIQISKIKRRKVEVSNEIYFKNESRYFFLPNSDSVLIPVCKTFFLATLGHKTDGVITELSKAVKKGKLYGSVTKERKKERSGRKKIDGSVIINHIMSFNPVVSHYRRHNAPYTKYLPRHLTLQQMYTDFKQHNPNFTCGKELYRQKIKELKLSFHMPKGDRCVDCALYEEDLKTYNDVTLMPEEMKIKYEDHKAKVETSIQRYRLEGNNKNTNLTKYVSMDLQKVIILPEMPDIKDAFFMSRLITFNLTFAPIEKKSVDSSTCVLWHEAIAGREASDIVNAIYAFIENNRDMQHLHLWTDNCTAQNKNWTIYTAMTMIVNNPSNSLESVTINYLTKGHTHMSADAVHGNIEMKMKRQRNVYDFQDFKDIVMKSRKNIKVIEVTKKLEWPKKKRAARQNEPLKEFNLNSVVQVKMLAGSRNLFYKTSFSDPGLVELDFLMKKFNCQLLPATNDRPRGIKNEKKREIITKLVSLMSESRKTFWNELPVNDLSADLTSHGQLDSF